MSTRPGVSFKPSPCVRDCRIDPYDKASPYVPPACSGTERSVHACVCSCIDMYPDWAAILGGGPDVSAVGMVAAVRNPDLACFCENADDYMATDSFITGTYYLQWDETALSVANRLAAKAAEICPESSLTQFRVYVPTPMTNLACVQSSADWDLLIDAGIFGDGPEPTGGTSYTPAIIYNVDHPELVDCAATQALAPKAFLFEVTTGCGLLLLCPNRNPGGATFTCPDCSQLCMSVIIVYADSFSTSCVDGLTYCTVAFYVTCPAYCTCASGTATVTFTLDGNSFSSDVAITCGDPETSVMSPGVSCNEFSGNWTALVEWRCDSEGPACEPGGTNCRDTPCPNDAQASVFIAIGGGVVT